MKWRQNAIKQVLTEVTESYKIRPIEINSGICDDWAATVFNALDWHYPLIDCEVWSTADWTENYAKADNHMFVKIDGKFYDAEALDGVESHEMLSFYQRRLKDSGRVPCVVQMA